MVGKPPSEPSRRRARILVLDADNVFRRHAGQQITINSLHDTKSMHNRVTLMEQRATALWDAKECGGSTANPVTECDLIVRGAVNGQAVAYIFNPENIRYIPSTEDGSNLGHIQMIKLAAKGNNSLTFTCVPPGAGNRMLVSGN